MKIKIYYNINKIRVVIRAKNYIKTRNYIIFYANCIKAIVILKIEFLKKRNFRKCYCYRIRHSAMIFINHNIFYEKTKLGNPILNNLNIGYIKILCT